MDNYKILMAIELDRGDFWSYLGMFSTEGIDIKTVDKIYKHVRKVTESDFLTFTSLTQSIYSSASEKWIIGSSGLFKIDKLLCKIIPVVNPFNLTQYVKARNFYLDKRKINPTLDQVKGNNFYGARALIIIEKEIT